MTAPEYTADDRFRALCHMRDALRRMGPADTLAVLAEALDELEEYAMAGQDHLDEALAATAARHVRETERHVRAIAARWERKAAQ